MSNIKPRDVDALLKQYSNLINSLYQQESTRFTYNTDAGRVGDKIKQDDLRSYIIYQFIILVKEYDPHGGVDFPYYIKEKLTLRTRHSYIKKVFRDEYREISDDVSANSVLANAQVKALTDDFSLHYNDTVFDGIADTKLENVILDLWLQGITNTREITKIIQENNDTPAKDISQAVKRMRDRLHSNASLYRLLNRSQTDNKKGLIARSKEDSKLYYF